MAAAAKLAGTAAGTHAPAADNIASTRAIQSNERSNERSDATSSDHFATTRAICRRANRPRPQHLWQSNDGSNGWSNEQSQLKLIGTRTGTFDQCWRQRFLEPPPSWQYGRAEAGGRAPRQWYADGWQ